MAEETPRTLAGYVLETMREGIISGRYPPGSRLDQKLLADELGVSLIPVREGLRQLEADGLVRIEPRRGVFVAERSPEELREISLIREKLEELATQLAVPRMSPVLLAHLEGLMQQSQQALEREDMHSLLELNREFHFTLYEASQQRLLMRMIASLWERFRLYSSRNTFVAAAARQSLREHEAILQACQQGNAEAAGALMRQHIRRATDAILAKVVAIYDL